ncbi:hypothetical protein NIES4072_59830 [Nostoc commune NIES-4072]|uniref:CopG domain protein DNA-binding domain protein n=1 Tax=Nostoc commune NIES-4072 TaxID=2005467 RepID=A0A2R5FVF3_NOSCO|nr:hypothetical protein NIES4070_31110 [Nostoc commune HK-02]GBG22275.1 hypothetical protein NIES4072_59830 [Nostoc commune NIES-4072]
MKNKQLRLRMSERRFNKLKEYAEYADKTMTQVIDELIDTLPNTKNADSSSTPCPVNPVD